MNTFAPAAQQGPRPARSRAGGRLSWLLAVLAALSVLAPASAAEISAAALPALSLDARSVTVSGLSSGGYMAAQFEVAYSASISGAAIVAGGPYGCSEGSVWTAALTCSCPYDASTSSSSLVLAATQLARINCQTVDPAELARRARVAVAGNTGRIDAVGKLRQHRVWLYSGDADPVVAPGIVDGLQRFYAEVKVPASRIKRVRGPRAGHGMPVVSDGNCEATRSPYLNGCRIDGAGELLKWLYQQPSLQPGVAQAGALKRFDQKPYRQKDVFDSLDDTGWVYVPAACEKQGAHCKLHVAFHGCEQGQNFVAGGKPYGTVFVEQAGYNRWAESAGMVVLYPQVLPSDQGSAISPYQFNPKGCWDFWGYTRPLGDASLYSTRPPFAQKDAPQMRAVKAMIDALLKPAGH